MNAASFYEAEGQPTCSLVLLIKNPLKGLRKQSGKAKKSKVCSRLHPQLLSGRRTGRCEDALHRQMCLSVHALAELWRFQPGSQQTQHLEQSEVVTQ